MRQCTYHLGWALLAQLALAGGALAQQQASGLEGLPPPGTMTAQIPEGREMYVGMAVSDGKQQVVTAVGGSQVEARLMARRDCNQKWGGCEDLASFPIRHHCMAIASDADAKPNVRATFVEAADGRKTKTSELSSRALDRCQASGAKKCGVQGEYCF
ncbi:MAG TPA: hypothetical protein DEA38_17470 [Stenotrophomonas sp.]|nr:hypothetical protein [Stenotrophomonas sp.]